MDLESFVRDEFAMFSIKITSLDVKVSDIDKKVQYINILEERQKNDRAFMEKLDKTVDDLNATMDKLNITLATMSGEKKGSWTIIGLVWTVIVSITLAAASMVVKSNSDIAVLQEKVKDDRTNK